MTKKSFAKEQFNLTPMQVISLVTAAIILTGTLLLMLPAASRDDISVGFIPALFTATSATCITGLSLFDTYTQWSAFGQIVICLLTEIGGLGFMCTSALMMRFLHRKIGMRQNMILSQAMNIDNTDSILPMQIWVLRVSLMAQGGGALILFLHFLPKYGVFKAINVSVFLAVAAFCNAGFDIFGFIEPGCSLSPFAESPIVLLTVAALVIFGGLGFFVLDRIHNFHTTKRLDAYSRMVLISTAVIIIFGTTVFCLAEWNNPLTMGSMSVPHKILNGFFQSVTTRTAGFEAIDQTHMTDISRFFSDMYMLIGGSSNSTAGGVKTVTVAVILLYLTARARGSSQPHIFKRAISFEQFWDAITITGLMLILSIGGAIFIRLDSDIPLTTAFFETISALSTTGLSLIGSSALHLSSQILSICYMFFGRVGIITISLSFLMHDPASERVHYANTKFLIG